MPAAVGEDAVGAIWIVGDETLVGVFVALEDGTGTDEAAELPSVLTSVGDETAVGFLGAVGDGFGADEAAEFPFMAAGVCANETVVLPSSLAVFDALAPCKNLLFSTGSYIFLVISLVC